MDYKNVCKCVKASVFVLLMLCLALSGVFAQDSLEIKGDSVKFTLDKIVVKGLIKDDSGEPLAGVTIFNNNSKKTAFSDVDGRYTIEATKGDELLFSFIGMKDKTITVSKAVQINVQLVQSAIALEDIVVTGYQTLSKERATGSFSVITKNSLDKRLQTDILSKIEGLAAGLTAYKGLIQIRGRSTINGNPNPLYVVDGVPYEGDLKAINPSEIENITLLKDATAASIYGARSSNGVIVITTKSGGDRSSVEYSGSVAISPYKDNRKYFDLMSSREMVNFQTEMFNVHHAPYSSLNSRYSINEVEEILYKQENGSLSRAEAEAQLEILRNRENYDQIKDEFLRSQIEQQHNLSVRGGGEKFKYSASVNFTSNMANQKGISDNRIGYNVRTDYKFFKWLQADFSLMGSFYSLQENIGFKVTDFINGKVPSYRVLYNEQGDQLPWMQTKSVSEINRLKSLGLNDETFYPIAEQDKGIKKITNSYSNINAGVRINIIDGLSANLRFQTEMVNGKNSLYYSSDSYKIKTQINNSSIINPDKSINHLVPEGAYLSEYRDDKFSYTLRVQLDYIKTFKDKHDVNVIAGAERRRVHSTSTSIDKYGYDDLSLNHKYLDEKLLSQTQQGTESLTGSYSHAPGGWPTTFKDREDRYVSFYANGSYTYDKRYAVTAGIRMDQSNLFGTDPKYQYKPLWSAGISWYISKETFLKNVKWIDILSLRATYGVNGNIAKESGPYMIITSYGANSFTGNYSSGIVSPPNSGLRWERTNQINFGVDFGFLSNRISG